MQDPEPSAKERINERLAALPSYGWRNDPSVPAFPDEQPLIVFDGVCVLCSGFAKFVARRDPGGQLRFTAAQSALGQALYRHFGLNPVDFETNLLIVDGKAHAKLSAFTGVMRRLGPPWSIATAADWLPAGPADELYDRIARNRYRIFGRRESCIVPDSSWRARIIE